MRNQGLGPCFHHPQKQMRCPSRVLCERAGLLADIAAADHWIHAKLLTTTRCPARFNLDGGFLRWMVPGRRPR
jgi:hypothetical protein